MSKTLINQVIIYVIYQEKTANISWLSEVLRGFAASLFLYDFVDYWMKYFWALDAIFHSFRPNYESINWKNDQQINP